MAVFEMSGWTSEKLTTNESTQMLVGPSITTTTFFRGQASQAEVALSKRLLLILKANPWLCGKLVKEGKKQVNLEYLSGGEEIKSAGVHFINGVSAGKKPAVASEMNYEDICNEVANTICEVPPGNKLVGKSTPLITLSVIADSKRPTDTFVVILSISHIVVDGFGYYQILEMLNEGSKILKLSPTRKHEIMEQSAEAIGKDDFNWMTSGAVICNVVCSMLCGKKAIVRCFEIDGEKVNSEKEKAASSASGGFVSTNDVIVSSFGNACSTSQLLMPINFRNKLPLFNDNDAGNYEGSLLFAGEEEYGSPANIRNVLKSGPPKYLRGADKMGNVPGGPVPLPRGFCGTAKSRLGMVTNWAFGVFDELKVEGCEQIVHLPHTNCKMIPFDICVIFKAKAGRIAAAYFVRNIDEEGLKEECPVGKMMKNAENFVD